MMHTEQSYRAHWATLTGKAPSEIYVPEALRPKYTCTWCSELKASAPVSTCSEECRAAETAYVEGRLGW